MKKALSFWDFLLSLTDKMEERGIQKAILVVQSPLTAFAKEAINDVAPKHLIEYFLESELLVS